MRCIFCLNERPLSIEHVFPDAVGRPPIGAAIWMLAHSGSQRDLHAPIAN